MFFDKLNLSKVILVLPFLGGLILTGYAYFIEPNSPPPVKRLYRRNELLKTLHKGRS